MARIIEISDIRDPALEAYAQAPGATVRTW